MMTPDLPWPSVSEADEKPPTPNRRHRWLAAVLIVALVGFGLHKFDADRFERHLHSPAVLVGMCGGHLHQLGFAILLYQQDHSGHYPASLADLIATEPVAPETLICPASDDEAPSVPGPSQDGSSPNLSQITTALSMPGRLSYVYCGHADWTGATVASDAIVFYEPPANHGETGCNFELGDGSSEWIPMPRAARLIAAAAATTRPVSAATVP
jgi:hypothetical protein